MTKFNPNGKKVLTYGEALSPAMEITNADDAKQYLESYVKYLLPFVKKDNVTTIIEMKKTDANINFERLMWDKAVEIAKANLGYFAGYYSDKTRRKVEKLFECQHPIFGSIEELGSPTPDEAAICGLTKTTLRELRS